VTYDTLVRRGLVDWRPGTRLLTMPLIVLLSMNTLLDQNNKVLPDIAEVENPFEDGAAAFERLSLTAMYVRWLATLEFDQADAVRPLASTLRPGAFAQGLDGVTLTVSLLPRFQSMSTHLPMAEPAVDSVVSFLGTVNGELRTVIFAHQDKWQMPLNPATGLAPATHLDNGTINNKLIPAMRKVILDNLHVFQIPEDQPLPFIVYDVFSIHEGHAPVAAPYDFQLQANEGLLITRKEGFEQVVGKTLAVRNRL
jgi:hypothetical protein